MKIEFIETEKGNLLLENLKRSGWRLVDEYPTVFDKGIDYDFYIFRKNDMEIKLEWTNWFEWEVSGSSSGLRDVRALLQNPA